MYTESEQYKVVKVNHEKRLLYARGNAKCKRGEEIKKNFQQDTLVGSVLKISTWMSSKYNYIFFNKSKKKKVKKILHFLNTFFHLKTVD